MGLLDYLYPRKCVGCGKTGRYFCDSCRKEIVVSQNQICPQCGRKAIDGRTHLGCRKRWGVDGLTSLFKYQSLIRLGIHGLKYRFLTDMEKEFHFLAAEQLLKLKPGWLSPEWQVTAVPLYWRRLNWRGFNQAELVAGWVSQAWGLKKDDLLVRIKSTRQQVKLTEKRRRENVQAAFKVKLGARLPKQLLLVDDVWTSGATMKATGRVLKKAGVARVWALTLAR